MPEKKKRISERISQMRDESEKTKHDPWDLVNVEVSEISETKYKLSADIALFGKVVCNVGPMEVDKTLSTQEAIETVCRSLGTGLTNSLISSVSKSKVISKLVLKSFKK